MLGKVFACLALVVVVTACSGSGRPPDSAAIADNNRAVGMMGQFEIAAARELFADVTRAWPDWTDARLNLAVATLNRQQEGDEALALQLANEVLESEPDNLRAHFLAGLTYLYIGQPGDATPHFRFVAEADASDAYSAYYLAQCLAQQDLHDQALPWYERAMETDPYLRSAYYGAFQSLQRLGQNERATALAGLYQRLENNPRSRLAEFKYTRMGPRGEALAVNAGDAALPAPQPEGALFMDAVPLQVADSAGLRWHDAETATSLTAADIDGDGWPDLFLPGVMAPAAGGAADAAGNLLLWGRPGSGYTADVAHPLAAVSNVNAALWGDFDNDGLVDVYLCRRGENQLWRQTAANAWEDVTESSGAGGADLDTVDGAFFDADHDGDLDLYLVNSNGADELLNNNLDGSFRPLAAEFGIAGGSDDSISVIPADIDSDRDVDLIVLNRTLPHQVYINDRLWSYRPAEGYEQFSNRAALAAVAADIDADGLIELYTIDRAGELLRWQARDGGAVLPDRLGETGLAGQPAAASLAVHDVNGDGRAELIVSSAGGWAVLQPGTDSLRTLYAFTSPAGAPLAASLPFIGNSLSGPSMLAYSPARGGIEAWDPGPGRHPFVTLTLSGRQDGAQSMRSNASGIGAVLAVRAGDRWSRLHNFRSHSGPGQSLQPLAVGLAGATRADFVAIDWSDGVFQSELGVATGSLQPLTETQRQLSSCPVLFAWNGSEYTFVSDVLGVGGLGYATGPGQYSTPRPWENFLLPEGSLQSREGRFEFKIAEPMEEIAYLDAARLAIYDLPPGWRMVMDERMGISEPAPTGRPIFYRHELQPAGAANDRGRDVLATIAARDGVAAPVGKLDPRFIGRLQDEHVLTLEFAQPLDAQPGQPVLVIDGWVEYPYSQTNFAAWQAGAAFAVPSLDAAADGGEWQTVSEQFGYPAGMPRRMSLPLTDLPPGSTRLRLRSNMQIYWDRIAVAYSESLPEHQRRLSKVERATMRKSGFARRHTFEQFRPHYDYAALSPFWDTRYMAGNYTRMGRVDELVGAVDDAVAIIGPGEEVHLEFAAAAPQAPGWGRFFVLEMNGWAKDMDLYTRDGETVGPLPVTGKPAAVRDALHARYNTRYQAGR